MIKNTVLFGLSSIVSCSYALIDLDHAGEHHEKLALEHHMAQKLLFTPESIHVDDVKVHHEESHEALAEEKHTPDIHTIKRHGHHIEQLADSVEDDGIGSLFAKAGTSIAKGASKVGKYIAPAAKSVGKAMVPIAAEMAP